GGPGAPSAGGVRAVSGPGAAVGPSAGSGEGSSAAAEWSRLREGLGQCENPEDGLLLLQGYADRFPGDLPPDFEALRGEYTEAAAWRRATRDPPQPEASEWVFSDGGEDPTAAAVEGAGEAAPTAPPPGGAAPGPDGDPSVPDPTGVGPGATAGAAPGPSASRSGISVDMGRDDLRADALVDYLAQLARLEYRIPPLIEPHVRAGNGWMLEYGEESEERDLMLFVVGTVLPALEEALPKLVAGSRALAGARLPGREYAQCTLHEVALNRIVLQERTPHGVMLRSIEWQRHSDPVQWVVYLSRLAQGKAATVEARRSYLALLLFSRYGKLWEEALEGLPATVETRLWDSLRRRLAAAADEGRALRTWRRAVEFCGDGELIQAYRALIELQATRSGVASRYAARIEALLAKTGKAVPENIAGRLVREATQRLAAQPEEALRLLNLAVARYGNTDFPEKKSIEALRLNALKALPLNDVLQRSARRSPLDTVVAFGRSSTADVPTYLSMRLYVEAVTAAVDVPPRIARCIPLLQGPALLEMGDWAAAAKELAQPGRTVLGELPPLALASVYYAQALCLSRYRSQDPAEALRGLRACRDQGLIPPARIGLPIAAMLAEYALLQRDPGIDPAGYLSPAAVADNSSPEEGQRYILMAAALQLECGKPTAAAALLTQAAEDNRGRPSPRRDKEETACLHALLQVMRQDAPVDSLSALPFSSLSQWHLRLLAAVLTATTAPVPDRIWLQFTEAVEVKGTTFGPVGGDAVYSVVLARVGERLAARDPAAAAAALDWSLSQPHAALFPYYARLSFLRTGLGRLCGTARGGRDLSDTIAAASCASRIEEALAAAYVGENGRQRAKEAARGAAETRFWYEWLALADADGAELAAGVQRLNAVTVAAAERRFARGVGSWCARRDGPAADRQD
ncbi:MAG: hypothetical protein JXR77_16920, partial [Lentisphaeria bacterium]|nr:hypothetical protein [Lentisphaeria bacterium]